ncbi:MAG: 16S rRNA (cytidine(1402)-2'-O)-methyltransferase [Ignavibacteriae bacterium]|nr:16S rRNA (cytidine(1402)-2'-O)-methyltransferase [Ignavibacteriota bacterium]
MQPTLYITPTPIGNYEDITLRALKVLNEVDFIFCEELKPANRLLAHFNISKELISLNEHNEREIADEVISKLIEENKSAALISDGGTPLFSDPGHYLVELCILNKIKIVPLPGANSLIPALVSSGLDIEKFYYYGWLSPKSEIRKNEFHKLKKLHELIIILETPYRLKRILTDVISYFGANQKIVLAFNLTMEDEQIFRNSASKILKIITEKNLKGEFVLLLDNRKN